MKIRLKDVGAFNRLLLRKGYTKIAFSKEIGMAQSYVVLLSNGKRHMSPKTAKKILEVLEEDFDELFIIEEEVGSSVG